MASTPYLSIVIPAYNEAERLPETLAVLRDWVEQQPFSIEVLIVDDGSSDDTTKVVSATTRRFPALRLIKLEQNQGKGGAVREGMLQAKGQFRLFTDADNSTPISEINKLLPYTEQYEVIIGSRYLEPGSIKVKQPWKRRVLSRFGNKLIQLWALPGIVDTQCGFKLFSAKAAHDIFPRQEMRGWSFDVEILTIAQQLGYAIKEVPVDWYDARQSKLRAVRSGKQFLRDLRIIRGRIRTNHYS